MDNLQQLTKDLAPSVLDIVDAVILAMDSSGRIVLFNKASEVLTGYRFDEVKDKHPWDLFILPEEVEGVKNVFQRLTAGDFPNHYTNYWQTRSGEKRQIRWSNTALTDENQAILYIIATGIDITEQEQTKARLAQHQAELEETVRKRTAELNNLKAVLKSMAQHDELTGLYNRRYFNETLSREIHRCTRNGDPLSVLLCDVDYFKNFNDFYGHLAGDQCLKDVAAVLSQVFHRASDTTARFGGEEFIVILPNTSAEQALGLAETLRNTIWEKDIPHTAQPTHNRVSISVGVTTFQSNDIFAPEEIIRAADTALYNAKENGRNRVESIPQLNSG
jgi:diguanylate cyclase (GGDEF)-like protein/PAS domain S-box-containing protein